METDIEIEVFSNITVDSSNIMVDNNQSKKTKSKVVFQKDDKTLESELKEQEQQKKQIVKQISTFESSKSENIYDNSRETMQSFIENW